MPPITSADILAWMNGLSKQLDQATAELAEVEADAVRKKVAAEKAYAKAFLVAEGSVDLRKQQAVLAAEDERLAHYLAEANLHALMERIRTLRSRIEVARSVGATQRSEMSAAGLGQP